MIAGIYSTILLVIVALVGAVFVVFAVVFMLAALIEKHPLKQFVALQSDEELAVTPYMEAMNERVAVNGFERYGTLRHAKGGTYRVYASFWLSPERDILVVVGGGKLARMALKKTLLFSRKPEGDFAVTTDDFGEGDISGLYDIQVRLNADFDELLHCHRARIAAWGMSPRPIGDSSAAETFEEIEAQVAYRLENIDCARFVDPARSTWRYTLKGALRLYFQSFLKQLRQGAAQRGRMDVPRPGDSRPRPAAIPMARPAASMAEPTPTAIQDNAPANVSSAGTRVRFRADSPHLLIFDPLALNALRDILAAAPMPPNGPTAEQLERLNRELSIGYYRIVDFGPGEFELDACGFQSCYEDDVFGNDALGRFSVDSGAVIVVDHAHAGHLANILSWEQYDLALQTPLGDYAPFQRLSDAMGGPYYALLFASADTPFAGDGTYRLTPGAVRPAAGA